MFKKFIFVIIVSGLGFSMLGCTSGSSQRYPRYPNYPYPGGQGYPGYPPGGYNNNRMEQVQTLADHLKDATAEVTEEARETESVNLEASTITQLEELETEAREFQQNIGRTDNPTYQDPRYGDPRYGDPRYGGYPGYSDPRREDFTEVLQKYYAARRTVLGLPQENDVQKDFERVTNIIRNLTRLYGYRFDPDYEYLEPTIR